MDLTIYEHLDELRKRMRIVLITFIAVLLIGISVAKPLLTFIVSAIDESIIVMSSTPFEGATGMIITGLFLACFISVPLLIYHLYKFVKPVIPKTFSRYLIASYVLFLLGCAFGVYFALTEFNFFMQFNADMGLANSFTISSVINLFVTSIIFGGIMFQIPMVILLLDKLEIVSYKQIAKSWNWILISILVISAAITPGPDAFSQLLIAAPTFGIFMSGIGFTAVVKKFGGRSYGDRNN